MVQMNFLVMKRKERKRKKERKEPKLSCMFYKINSCYIQTLINGTIAVNRHVSTYGATPTAGNDF